MKAIILAAGRGSRMGSLTDKQPKCKILLLGKPLIEWQLESLYDAGIEDIGLVRGYLSHKIDYNLKYFENKRWAQTNMVVSLLSAKEWLQNNSCIVAYSDIIYSSRVIKDLQNSDGDIVISYYMSWKKLWKNRFSDPLIDAETFRIDANGSLLEIGNQPTNLEQIEGQYMGLLKFTPKGWRKVFDFLNEIDESTIGQMDMTCLLNTVINKKLLEIRTVASDDWWFEIDNMKDLVLCQGQLKNCSKDFKSVNAKSV